MRTKLQCCTAIMILAVYGTQAQNVGIGTTTPAATLDVNGNVRISGGSPGSGKVLTSDANGIASWSAAGLVQSSTYILSDNEHDVNLLSNGYVHAGHTSFLVSDTSTITTPPNQWIHTNQYTPDRVLPYVMAIDGNKFLVFGGWGSDQADLSNGAIYDPVADTWTPIPDMGDGLLRQSPVVVWGNGRLMVWGGTDYTTLVYHTTGKIYDPNTNAWTNMSNVNAPGGREFCAYGYDPGSNSLLVWGGSDSSGYLNNGARYSLATNTWSVMSNVGAPAARGSMGFATGGGKLLIYGGYGTTPPVLSDAYTYNVSTNTWTLLPSSGLIARISPAVHYTGSGFLVWSGFDNSGNVLNSGALYNTAFNSWAVMNTANAPAISSSYHATALVSNSLFAADYAAAGKYDITTNTWAAMPVTNRVLHGLAGNAVCLFTYGNGDNSTYLPIPKKGERLFWTAQSVIQHTETNQQLYLYLKN